MSSEADPPVAIRPDQELVAARPSMSTALAVQRAGTMQQAFQGLIPTSIGEAFILSGHLAKSTAIPKSLKDKPESVLTVVLAGMELGLSPIRALQSITNISGTLCMKADLQLGIARGVLAFYDEGFELKGKTDANIGRRVTLALQPVQFKLDMSAEQRAEQVELIVAKLMAAALPLPEGKPYGWAMGIRVGSSQVHVRTFTWDDAEAAVIYEKDEDNPGQPAAKKPLSQKFNYKSFPGDMYPKRARTRVLQILANDVLAGLPAVEQLEGGQVIDAEFTVSHGDGDDVDTLLAAIRDDNAEAATTIEAAFTQLRMGKAAQLQKLVQFKGKPKELVDWLKTEWAARQGKGRATTDVLSGDAKPAAPAKPAEPKPADPPAEPKPAADQTAAERGAAIGQALADAVAAGPVERQPLDARAHAGDGDGAAREAGAATTAQPKPTPGADLAARMRKNLKTF